MRAAVRASTGRRAGAGRTAWTGLIRRRQPDVVHARAVMAVRADDRGPDTCTCVTPMPGGAAQASRSRLQVKGSRERATEAPFWWTGRCYQPAAVRVLAG